MFEQKSSFAFEMFEQKSCFAPKMSEQKPIFATIQTPKHALNPNLKCKKSIKYSTMQTDGLA
jgi:hypothetical protein